jgi:two-component system, chemotaxis family, protein-glutamate methylesterase/glutaminase
MPLPPARVIVIGTSAGGLEALVRLHAQLPANLKASLFVVQHMAPDATASVLVRNLEKNGPLACSVARDGDPIVQGHLYVAPPDHHMLLGRSTVLVTKGARENRYRPAIDPLFRSAAVAHRASAIGVVLTGRLDDGTSGLTAIKRCGGVTVVQDPDDAAYPDMPRSALGGLRVDHCVALAEMGALFQRLVDRRPGRNKAVPDDIAMEATIAERVVSDMKAVDALGARAPYNCPDCGGVLWDVTRRKGKRFRCHVGHAFTAATLLTAQSSKIEETLWISLRMLEERRNLLQTMRQAGPELARAAAERAKETEVHILRIRELLLSSPKPTNGGRKRKS